jgi:hypothetical protein
MILQLETRTNPSGVTSVEARPPGVLLQSTIIHEGPFWNRSAGGPWSGAKGTHDVVQTFCGTKAGRAGADDENINASAHRKATTVSKSEKVNAAERRVPTYISLTLVGATLEVFRLRLMVKLLAGVR